MASINNLHDLFHHELKDIYDAEARLVDALGEQARESKTPEIRKVFEDHQKVTQKQKERVEKVFEIFGKKADRGSGCSGMEGLLEEHRKIKQSNPAPEILDVFNLTAAAKVERYEVTAYEGLVNLATELGLDDAVDLLKQNLQEEQQTLEKVRGIMQQDNPLKKVAAR